MENFLTQNFETMDNIYIRKYKSTVLKFFEKAKQISASKKANTERYQKDIADDENAKLDEQLVTEYRKAKESINAVFEDIRSALAMGSFPNVESLTADRVFFNGEVRIPMTESEVITFIERYTATGNFVMLRLISRYMEIADKKNTELDEKNYPYAVTLIHLPEEYLGIYQTYGQGALSLIDSIYSDVDVLSEVTVNAYADKNYDSQSAEIIGNGRNIAEYKSWSLPESAKHTFDSVTLNLNPASLLGEQSPASAFKFTPVH